MTASHDFLERLGLADDADARAIRRAYARELKLVDQERDPGGFQQLRDCYETALEWAAWKLRRAEEEQAGPEGGEGQPTQPVQPAPVAAPQAPGPVHAAEPALAESAPAEAIEAQPDEDAPPAPFALGRIVFEEFRETIPALVAHRAEPRDKPWIAALRRFLDDERLLNLEARLSFEIHIAWVLADGWRPGHEVLFPAASGVFGWEGDRRATARLGQAGELLHAAIEQRLSFGSQDVQTRQRQRDVLALLRQSAPPSDNRIAAAMPALEQLVQRFPHWLPVIAPSGNIGYWRERYQASKGKPFVIEEAMREEAREKRGGWRWKTIACVVLLLVGLLRALLDGTTSSKPAGFYPPSDRIPHETAEQERYRLAHPKPLYVDEAPSQARLDEIGARIDYKVAPDARPGALKADFQVFLDADGAILGVNKKKGSGVPDFDAAVAKAIRETRPFPPKTAKVFNVSYGVTITRKRKAAPRPAAPFHQKAPWEGATAKPPAKDGAPAWPPLPSTVPLGEDAGRGPEA